MPCMCGDTHCWSCGPAQGNNHCEICGMWDDDGGCDFPAVCLEYSRIADEIEAAMYKEMNEYEEKWEKENSCKISDFVRGRATPKKKRKKK